MNVVPHLLSLDSMIDEHELMQFGLHILVKPSVVSHCCKGLLNSIQVDDGKGLPYHFGSDDLRLPVSIMVDGLLRQDDCSLVSFGLNMLIFDLHLFLLSFKLAFSHFEL